MNWRLPYFAWLNFVQQEFFIEHLAQEIFENNDKQTEISYSGLAEVVQDNEPMEFLKGENMFNIHPNQTLIICFITEMVPKKITFQEYNDLMKKEQENVDYWIDTDVALDLLIQTLNLPSTAPVCCMYIPHMIGRCPKSPLTIPIIIHIYLLLYIHQIIILSILTSVWT